MSAEGAAIPSRGPVHQIMLDLASTRDTAVIMPQFQWCVTVAALRTLLEFEDLGTTTGTDERLMRCAARRALREIQNGQRPVA